jgi:5-methyltetrahydropteroyltriglutamate--homocysteine methyltransferase
MQHSIDRILTTHAGSIPRGEALGAMLIDQEQGKPVDQARLDALVDAGEIGVGLVAAGTVQIE